MAKLDFPRSLSDSWSRMTARERSLILTLGLVMMLMAYAALWLWQSQNSDKHHAKIAAYKQALLRLQSEGSTYAARMQDKQKREASISATPILFSTLLEEASSTIEGIQPINQEELPPVSLENGLQKRSVKFDLRGVKLEQLTKFLGALEARSGHIIITERLSIRSLNPQEDNLTVEVQIATWERQKSEGAPAGTPEKTETP